MIGTPGAPDQTVPDWGGSDGPITITLFCPNCGGTHHVEFQPLGTVTMRQSAHDPTKILHATHMGRCSKTGKLLYAGSYTTE